MITSTFLLITFFCLGYCAIIFEFQTKANKTAVALFLAAVLWVVFFVSSSNPLSENLNTLSHHISSISQILFFLLGAMTLVELIDSHNGFYVITRLIRARSKRYMLWIICGLCFCLSAVLDNLTTTILMISILKKLIPDAKERLLLACMVVVASNAGGAWSPIGDVTTTMLWVNGQISSTAVMRAAFIPSILAAFIPILYVTFRLKGGYDERQVEFDKNPLEPGARIVFFFGILSFLFVPIFKWLTGLPPYMGMLLGLSILWFVTDLLHHKYEHRHHLRIPYILTKIDVSNILFFLGILLSVHALESAGVLQSLATVLNSVLKEHILIAFIIGILSSIVDNVPLVAASIGMYPLSTYPMDSKLWLMIAYAAGTGGSILLIGSSPGVALMGLEKIHFFQYMKKITIPAFLGYLAGMAYYLFF